MRSLALILVFFATAPGLQPAWAGVLDDARLAGVLRVGTPGDYAPFSLRGPDGSYKVPMSPRRNGWPSISA